MPANQAPSNRVALSAPTLRRPSGHHASGVRGAGWRASLPSGESMNGGRLNPLVGRGAGSGVTQRLRSREVLPQQGVDLLRSLDRHSV
jgi:hypothetical protein